MLLFATDEFLQHLATSIEWYMGGNFKLAPRLFMQLYVIRMKFDEGAISYVCGLLCGKGEQNYHTMFTAIIQWCHNLGLFPAPTSVNADFEMVVYNCIRNIFGPLVELNGCFYHLCQSTWHHVQEIGLTALYMTKWWMGLRSCLFKISQLVSLLYGTLCQTRP